VTFVPVIEQVEHGHRFVTVTIEMNPSFSCAAHPVMIDYKKLY